MRHSRYVLLAFLGIALVIGLSANAIIGSAFDQFGVYDPRYLGAIPLSGLLAIGTGGLGFFVLIRHERAMRFADEVVNELSKVTWPTRQETMRNTTTVIVTTLLVAAILAGYDFVWQRVSDFFFFG